MGDLRAGVLIAFEGVEGAGKSTQLGLLRAALEGREGPGDGGREVVVTREPGGTPAGERVRALLLDPAAELHPRTEALLFAAARAELVERVIRPALERGAVVLCDRYLDSSLAYQGGARGLGLGPVEQVNRFATAGLRPDLVVLLDLDPAHGLGRRSGGRDRIEAQELAFHRRVRQAFLDLAAADPERHIVVDGSAPVPEVAAQVHAAVLPLLEGSGEPHDGPAGGRSGPPRAEGPGDLRGGAPVGREGSGEPQGGAPVGRLGS
jgi:dTMP kinase